MKVLKVLTFLWFIVGFSFHLVFADTEATIDEVLLQDGDPTSIQITITFSDNCIRDTIHLTTSLEDIFILQIFTDEPAEPCEKGDIQITQEISSPENEDYKVIVLLYSGTSLNDSIQLLDYETLFVKQAKEENNECLIECSDMFKECSENCTDVLNQCREGCNDDPCLDECDGQYDECSDDCIDILNECESACKLGATVDITPETLNLKSKGRWVTAFIELSGDYDEADINVESIGLEEDIAVETSELKDGFLMVKFNRQEVINLIKENYYDFPLYAELTITGNLNDDNRTSFEAKDSIRVIDPGKDKNKWNEGDNNNGEDNKNKDHDEDDEGKGNNKDKDDKGKGNK